MPRATFRADASATIGHGHVMRCLALAGALREHGVDCSFLLRRQPGDAVPAIESAGFTWHRLPDAAANAEVDARCCAEHLYGHGGTDLLVLDHYQRGADWVAAVRRHARTVLVIDDLADRPLAGDLLLDQNWHDTPDARYAAVWPAGTPALFGPAYALLRPEFAAARRALRERSGRIEQVVIAFGGSDPPNATEACLAALHGARPGLRFEVLLGSGAPQAAAVAERWGAVPGVSVGIGVTDVAQRFAAADLFVGAGGSMTWERASLGLPGITLPIADNQLGLCARLAAVGEGVDLGAYEPGRMPALVSAFEALATDAPRVQAMGRALGQRCDGQGAARVAEAALARLATAAPPFSG
ncbi:MAG: UDP-2,4-diacetamido-2,4,6-trideoxy-beta-L-altropyranose hydrolase [Burkholderiales bacterium]|nr:UDP-2,4-diacetamido-2,4,6-trideoxy-beta-L-altropyranose hydrolase [Burkholderiales bacterium]